MNPILREHLVSAMQTFIATFLTILGTSIGTVGSLEWSTAVIWALILSAARAAIKEVFARLAPPAFGGRVKHNID